MKKFLLFITLFFVCTELSVAQETLSCGTLVHQQQNPFKKVKKKTWKIILGKHAKGKVVFDFYNQAVPDNYRLLDAKTNKVLAETGWIGSYGTSCITDPTLTSYNYSDCSSGFLFVDGDKRECHLVLPPDFALPNANPKGAGRVILEVDETTEEILVEGYPNPNAFTIWEFIVSCVTCQPLELIGPSTACETEEINLSATTGYNTYVWLHNNVPIHQSRQYSLWIPHIEKRDAGTYHVIASNSLCKDTSNYIEIEVNTLISASIYAPVKQLCKEDTATLKVIINGGSGEYQTFWNNTTTGKDLQVQGYNNLGQYSVLVTDTKGCTASDSIVLQSCCKPDVYLPNTFSPNGNGINDTYTIGLGFEVQRVEDIVIANRWGSIVWRLNHTIDRPSNDSKRWEIQTWDGRFHGTECDIGEYAVYIRVHCADSQKLPVEFKTGVLLKK